MRDICLFGFWILDCRCMDFKLFDTLLVEQSLATNRFVASLLQSIT
jgi:hypothetical protein